MSRRGMMFADSVIAWAITLVCAYLMGSFSTSITVARLFYHQDIRKMGSGNAGATNTLRNYGVKKALLVMLGDSLKAILAMVLAKLLVGQDGVLYAGSMAVVGHIFPAYYGLRGGKGVMSAAAMILFFDWRMFLVVLVIFAVVVVLTRYVSLASILCAAAYPVSMAVFYPGRWGYWAASIALAALVIGKHHANIRRLLHGQESKVGAKKRA